VSYYYPWQYNNQPFYYDPNQFVRENSFKTHQVPLDSRGSVGDALDFFVHTNSNEHPIATLSQNSGFPPAKSLYVGKWVYQGLKGVRIIIFFDGPARGKQMLVNISQPGMTGPYTVIPLT
jgi:hypothetical protein